VPSENITEISVYRSEFYPDGRSRRSIFSIEMVRPLGIAMLPIMIGTLVAMLEGFPVLSVLYVGFPIALAVSFLWTWLRLRGQICEILISNEKVAFRSIFATSEPSEGPNWKLLIDIRQKPSGISATVGLEEFVLDAVDWSNWITLVNHLKSAHHSQTLGVHND
jgi:hypothetical protein